MTTYKIEILSSYNNQAVYEQLAFGDYGMGWEKNPTWAKAVAQRDAEFFIRHAVNLGDCKRTKDGRFKTKRAAQKALHNIELFNAIGQGIRRALDKPEYGMAVKIIAI